MFNLIANKEVAKQAREAILKKIKNSINYLVHECISRLDLEHAQIALVATKLAAVDHMTPAIHYFHHALQHAMRQQNISAAKSYLTKLISAICTDTNLSQGISISTIKNSDWENFIVSEAIKLTKQDCGIAAKILPLSSTDLSLGKYQLNKALNMIAKYDTNTFEEISAHVQQIKLFRGKTTMGFTDVRILGAMLIRMPRKNVNPLMYFIEHIVHEASHIHMNSLMAIDPLILNSPDERFISPLRPDPRPMFGVFHATYVSAKISQTFMQLFLSIKNTELLHTLAETLDETIRGMIEIENQAKLTLNGQAIITSIKEFITAAKSLSEWRKYNFHETRTHRFGLGVRKLAFLEQQVA